SDNASQPFRRPHTARHHPSTARVASAFPRAPPGRLAPQGTRLLLGPHSPSPASNPADKPRLRPTTGGSRRGSCVSHALRASSHAATRSVTPEVIGRMSELPLGIVSAPWTGAISGARTYKVPLNPQPRRFAVARVPCFGTSATCSATSLEA